MFCITTFTYLFLIFLPSNICFKDLFCTNFGDIFFFCSVSTSCLLCNFVLMPGFIMSSLLCFYTIIPGAFLNIYISFSHILGLTCCVELYVHLLLLSIKVLIVFSQCRLYFCPVGGAVAHPWIYSTCMWYWFLPLLVMWLGPSFLQQIAIISGRQGVPKASLSSLH